MAISEVNPVIMENVEQQITKPLADSLVSRLKQENRDRLHLYHEIGLEIMAARREIEKQSGGIYSAKLVKRLAEMTGISPRLLHAAELFAKMYSVKDLERICATLLITWSHVRLLMKIKDPKVRRRMEKQVVEKKLSIDALRKLLRSQKAVQRPARSEEPKPHQLPTTPAIAMEELIVKSQQYRERTRAELFAAEYDIINELHRIAPDLIDDELCQLISDASAELEQLAQESAAQAEMLQTSLSDLHRRRELHTKFTRRVQAGEDPTDVGRAMTRELEAAS